MKKIFEKIQEKLEYARINCIPRVNGKDCSVEELNIYDMAFTYAEKLVNEVKEEYLAISEKKLTMADKIRSMSEEELAAVLMCPYDMDETPFDKMPCHQNGRQELVTVEECRKCCVNWLKSEAEKSFESMNEVLLEE